MKTPSQLFDTPSPAFLEATRCCECEKRDVIIHAVGKIRGDYHGGLDGCGLPITKAKDCGLIGHEVGCQCIFIPGVITTSEAKEYIGYGSGYVAGGAGGGAGVGGGSGGGIGTSGSHTEAKESWENHNWYQFLTERLNETDRFDLKNFIENLRLSADEEGRKKEREEVRKRIEQRLADCSDREYAKIGLEIALHLTTNYTQL